MINVSFDIVSIRKNNPYKHIYFKNIVIILKIFGFKTLSLVLLIYPHKHIYFKNIVII
jgi:hypothetical protein